MNFPKLYPGDIVCTTYTMESEGPNWLQWILSLGIRAAQTLNDVDGKARLTHSFIVTSTAGHTFEALWRYRGQNIFNAYAGQDVLIGRHKDMSMEGFYPAHTALFEQYYNRRYPAWKLPLFFLAPRILKWLPGKPVCSELTFKYLYYEGLVDHWRGVTPSYVADAIRRWRGFEIIYEGIMPAKD